MKRTILILAAVGLLIATPSCKKGENDPLLPFMSRDARITGTWNLTELTSREVDKDTPSGQPTVTDVRHEYFDGTLFTVTDSTDNVQNWTNSVSYTQQIIIEKDGSYMATITDDGDKTESTGSWWWLDDKKKKTRIAFDDDWNSYEIDQLKNKEMILKSYTYWKDTNNNGDVTESWEEMTMTFTKQK